MSDFGLFLMIALLVIFCAGDPDLIDALVKFFMGTCAQ
jgi:hypothetical protein